MIYLLPEDGTSLTIDGSRQTFLKYILRGSQYYATETEETPINYILPADIIDTDQIENTRYVKRLPVSYSKDNQGPFDISKTKPNRVLLQDECEHPFNWYEPIYHKQNSVEFFEAIEYISIAYCHLPEPAYKTIRHIRDINKPLKRKVFPDNKLHRRNCTHPFVQINGYEYLDHWVDQYKRDLTKYQLQTEYHSTNCTGILLIEETDPDTLRENYWNQLAGLTKSKVYTNQFPDDIDIRIIECAFLTLSLCYQCNIPEFYEETHHQPILRRHEKEIPVRHIPIILRSLTNGLATVFITNRAPNFISVKRPFRIYPRNFPVDILPEPTFLDYNYFTGSSNNTDRHISGRIALQGIPPGVHTQYKHYYSNII
jgi:hypothetical protein